MFTYKFEMPAVTATTVLVYEDINAADENRVLLGRRQLNSDAYPGSWSLIGGFLNVGSEQTVDTARRETEEEVGISIKNNRWSLFYVDDKPGSDPRYKQVVNICYAAYVDDDEYNNVVAGDDIIELKWIPIAEALEMDLAFDHNDILEMFEYGII